MALNYWAINNIRLFAPPMVARFQESATLEGVGKNIAGKTVYQGRPRAEWQWTEHAMDEAMQQIIATWTPDSMVTINLRRWKALAGDYVWETWRGYMQEPQVETRGGRGASCGYPFTILTLRFHYLAFVG